MDTKTRPELNQADTILEIAGWIALCLLWLMALINYKSLPASIPTHFNATGQVDDYGSRATILALPIIGTVLFVGMTILNRFPHVFNYPVKITPENMLKQYTWATRMIRVLKMTVIIVFMLIVWLTNSTAIKGSGEQVIWFLPMILAVIFVPLGFYIYKSFKGK
jgi:uncharacterized membrane protein